jgi:hypothetical protein
MLLFYLEFKEDGFFLVIKCISVDNFLIKAVNFGFGFDFDSKLIPGG